MSVKWQGSYTQPTLNGSSEIQHFECCDMIKINNGIMFIFYLRLPHIHVYNYTCTLCIHVRTCYIHTYIHTYTHTHTHTHTHAHTHSHRYNAGDAHPLGLLTLSQSFLTSEKKPYAHPCLRIFILPSEQVSSLKDFAY